MDTPHAEEGGQPAAEVRAVFVQGHGPAEPRPDLLQGRPPSDAEQAALTTTITQWRKVRDEAPVESLKRLEDAARQLVALTSTLQALYLAAFAFSDLRKRVTTRWGLLLYVVPVALWLGSQYCATRVYLPRPSNADLTDDDPGFWQRLRNAYLDAAARKYAWLARSHGLLILSGVVILALLVALAFLPGPQTGPTEILIVTPTP